MENSSSVPTGSNANKVFEIDLTKLAQNVWSKRAFVLRVAIVFFAAGVFVAIFSAKEYTSTIVMVPQSSDSGSKLGNLSGLASLAGISLSDMGGDQSISPTLYPQIMGSLTYQKELMQTQVKFASIDKSISIFDYYTNDEYKPFNLIRVIVKYTVGLPGVILKKIKDKKEDAVNDSIYLRLTESEKEVIKVLDSNVDLLLNDKDGYITLTASAPEPLVATQLVISAQSLLQKFITKIKIEKAQENFDFIQSRYNESRYDYEQTQSRLASFQDINRNVILSVAKAQEQKLTNDYNLAFAIYSELTKQLEQARIKVKDASPVLTIVQPAFVPIEKTKPKRVLIIFVCAILGVVVSCFYVFFNSLLNQLRKMEA